ncbi:hypothetical protein V6N11_044489 [Hibiscus sabdariffa]|uniref:Uncharacterized protein n=1 Tax=Hibiscus sabdariffa TaxID=183260 RepID=A0ABR2RFB8_9ROSI
MTLVLTELEGSKVVVSNVVEWVKSAQAQVDLIAATPIVESFGRMEPRQNSHISIAIPDDDRIGDDSIIGEISDAKINPVEESGQEWKFQPFVVYASPTVVKRNLLGECLARLAPTESIS